MHPRILFSRLFRRDRRSDNELDEELAAHIELAAEELRSQGIPEADAARQATLRFGGIAQTREAYRAQSRPPWIDSFAADLRYAARQLRRNPGFAVVATLTLALGIGATTAIYSVLQAVLVRSLPYPQADRLVYLYTPNPHIPIPPEVFSPSNADLRDIRSSNQSFSAITAFGESAANLHTADTSVRIGTAQVDSQFFALLGATPALGRVIQADDTQPGHASVAIISDALWRTQFESSPEALNRSITLDGKSYRIIGVMGRNMQFPSAQDFPRIDGHIQHTDVWTPLVLSTQEAGDRNNPSYYALARLKPGVSASAAQIELRLLMARLDKLHTVDPLGNRDVHGWTGLVVSLRDTVVGPVRRLLWLLLGAVCCVLLIACGNAANLLLARAAARTHELGMRATLGAGRSRLARQLLTESLLLSGLASACGLLLAWIFLRMLLRFDPGDIPSLQQTSLNLPVLLFVLVLAGFTCLLFGALPALSASRIDPLTSLKAAGSRGLFTPRSRLRGALVVGEIALASVLLAAAGLLLRSYQKVLAVQPGFAASTLTCSVALDSRYERDHAGFVFFQTLLERLSHLPGVAAAGASQILPLSGSHSVTTLWVDGYRDNRPELLVAGSPVTPQYFSAMQTPLLRGRYFTDADRTATQQVAIINRSFAETFFAGQNPLGKHIRHGADPRLATITIVGVVADVRNEALDQPPVPQLYSPFSDADGASIAVRSALPPQALAAAMRSTLRSLDQSLALADIHTMQQAVAAANARRRFQTILLSLFGGTAVLLALIGLYGLLAYSVRQRTAEIGLRIALGATRMRVLRMVVGRGMRLALIGLSGGLVAAALLARALTSLLYGVRPYDLFTFFAAPALVLLATLLACAMPAWRAARVEPMEALRSE